MPTYRSTITAFWSVILMLVITSGAFSAAKPILNIDMANEKDVIIISASSETPYNVNVFKSSTGSYMGFEFRGVLMNSGKFTRIHSGRVQSIKYSSYQNKPPLSRLVVNTVSAPEYTLRTSPDKKQTTITIYKHPPQELAANAEEKEPEASKNTTEGKAYKVAAAVDMAVSSEKLPMLPNSPKIDASAPMTKTPENSVQSIPVVKAAAAKPKASVTVKPVQPAKPAETAAKQKAAVVTQATGGKISLNFSDAEVVTVLKALALQSKQDIVVSKAVGGKITLNLTSVSPEQALDYVTKISGFTYVKQDNTFLVGTKASLLGLVSNDELNLTVEAIMLSYTSPNDVISILQTRFPDLKIRKSDTRWRTLPIAGEDSSKISVTSESNRSVGQEQSQKDVSAGGAGGGTAKGDGDTKQSASLDASQTTGEGESTMVTEQVLGREEQTKEDSNMLIISGAAKMVAEAKKMVVEMENAVYTSTLENAFEIYRIKHVRADGLSKTLSQLVPGIAISRAPQAGLDYAVHSSGDSDPIQPTDRAIIISGRRADIERAMEIIGKLDISTDRSDSESYDNLDSIKHVVELVTVKNVKGEDVLKAITQNFRGVNVDLISTKQSADKSDQPALDARGKISEISGSVLILSGQQGLVTEAKAMIAKMDTALQAALSLPEGAESAVKLERYEVKYVNAVELASSLKALIPAVSVTFAPSEGFDLQGPGPISISSDTGSATVQTASAQNQSAREVSKDSIPTNPRTLLLLGSEDEVKKALELAPTLDVKSPQIKITAKITSITESGEKTLGLNWDWSSFSFQEVGNTEKWIRQPVDFKATLDALYTSGDIQVLASPSMTILEGKPGVFFVGDEVTYITRVETTPTGQNVQTDKALVGIQLKVNGRISSDGNITLNLHPEVSTLKLSTVSAANVSLPIISRRFTDQIVRVKDGETYVVGGLIRNDETADMAKVPLLGDLPFLGNLFKHSVKSKQRTEVVMFITATIVDE